MKEREMSAIRKECQKRQSEHEKNAKCSKIQTRQIEADLKKEQDVLESVQKTTEVQRKECKKISNEIRNNEGKIFFIFRIVQL